MVSCAFRERGDMSDPTVMWIPRHLTLDIIRETVQAMDFWNTLKTTLVLNIGCSVVQVFSCALTGYGFARFSFRGKKLLFVIVIMMILVPTQVISLPLYSQFRYFGIKGLFSINLIDSKLTMYLPALTGNGICSGLMILIFRQFFRGMPKELEDAGEIDGAGTLRIFFSIMLPVIKPMPITPPTESNEKNSCPAVGFSFSRGPAARVATMGIMAIITPEKTVLECRIPYCSPMK